MPDLTIQYTLPNVLALAVNALRHEGHLRYAQGDAMGAIHLLDLARRCSEFASKNADR